uniref:Calponin-homology (CH) domain-containing protein n=1 Tax=Heterorhabditis bacteriophora TaxID=37862 RepID=A0A1I7XBL2_HETBA
MSDGSMQRTFHEAMRQRRTSLPANSLTLGKIQNSTSNVSEARGIVVDMLANKDLPTNVVSCLRAVATLLNPHTPLSIHAINDFGLPCVVENPYSGEQLIVSNVSDFIIKF